MRAIDVAKRLFGREPQGVPLDLHSCQVDAIAKICNPQYRKHILGLPMGVGKTYIGCSYIDHYKPSRSLIIAPEKAILSWLRHMYIWFPEILEHYVLLSKAYSKASRTKFLKDYGKNPSLSIITNPQLLTRDSGNWPTKWDSIVFDEYHKFIRNADTKMHLFLKRCITPNMLLISGSPTSKGAIDFFVPLNLFDKKLFSSYWKFARTWANIVESPYGKAVQGTRNEEQFRKVINDYGIVKSKKELGLQKKIRDILPADMTKAQEKAYEQMRDEFLIELEDRPPIIMLNTVSQYVQLRKLLSCPAQIDHSLGIGGAAVEVGEILAGLPKEERHSVIFTPFREGAVWLQRYFGGQLVGSPELDVPAFLLRGGVNMQQLYDIINKFKRTKGILVCTTDYAESFDLETADKCFHIGCSWDPQVNFQAEDRLDRMNNVHGIINSYYMQTNNTIDEDVMYTLVRKQTNVNRIYSNVEALKSLLQQ